jgi:acyl transferase domain-containing protein
MVDAFRRAFDGAPIRAPSVKLISNVTGEPVDGPLDADYWVPPYPLAAASLRRPVVASRASARAGGCGPI